MTDLSKPSGAQIYGTGTSGKQLWIYTPDGRWAPVPVGAGEDTVIRSLNIYHGVNHRWMVPAWGYELVYRRGLTNTSLDALDVRAPARTWSTTPFNPNYLTNSVVSSYSPMPSDYVRLFHLVARGDPNWRIVPLLRLTAAGPPSHSRMLLDYFWPRGATVQHQVTEYADGSVTTLDVVAFYTHNSYHILCAVQVFDAYTISHSPFLTRTSNFSTAGMIDFQVIRARLSAAYNQRSVDYTGQYAPMSQMTIRRVYVTGAIVCSVTIVSSGTGGPLLVNAVTFRIYAETSAAGTPAADPNSVRLLGVEYDSRYPSSPIPTGLLIFETTGIPIDFDGPNGQGGRYTSGSLTVPSFVWDFEAPGEDNISFYATIEGLPPADATNTEVQSFISFNGLDVNIHYATVDKDTPVESHHASTAFFF